MSGSVVRYGMAAVVPRGGEEQGLPLTETLTLRRVRPRKMVPLHLSGPPEKSVPQTECQQSIWSCLPDEWLVVTQSVWAAVTQRPPTPGLKQQTFISPGSEGGKSKARHCQIQCLLRTVFLAHGWLSSGWDSHGRRDEGVFLGSFFFCKI